MESAPAADIYVSPIGRDSNSGAKARPLASIAGAQRLARSRKSAGAVTVWLRGGTYYLPQTLVFTPEDSGTKKTPVTYAAFPGEQPVISGGVRLRLTWDSVSRWHSDGAVPAGLHSDQLFVNGERQIPGALSQLRSGSGVLQRLAADAFSQERAARWADPRGGFIHAMHRNMWGDFHYVITGKDAKGNVTYEGGWQNNRRTGYARPVPLRREHLRGTRRARRMVPRRRQDARSTSIPPPGSI